tara:strand:+ start:356 stop:1462 length:1107 start_codon:yes stop_codon:yes gene_type:complete
MKNLFLFIISLLIYNIVFSQCDGRYQTEIFNSITKTTVNYSDIYSDNEHTMDIYTPDGDTEINRPVILYLHGGSYTGGDKSLTDCVDFCESMAKKGYVTASLNYRLADLISFLTSMETQYETVLKSVADAKSAIRYFRKNYDNGNAYGIDPNTIFIGGYSAGAVTAIHLAYIDLISDLPTSPINVQTIVNNVGGANGLEGDAGNYGYSSDVSGVISFAGGINDVNWIDQNDEPLVSIQGTLDLTVNYNCGPGMNNPLILTLCGAGEMHPKADNVGIANDKLIFNGTEHSWAATGDSNPKFIQAIDFTSDFLFPLLPCNNTTNISNLVNNEKSLKMVVDIFGRRSNITKNKTLFFIYSDGSVQKKIIFN